MTISEDAIIAKENGIIHLLKVTERKTKAILALLYFQKDFSHCLSVGE